MELENPFLVSGYTTPEYFCNRSLESATMIESLRNGRNITLISPRRMGKTGLIKNVFYLLSHSNSSVITLYMDIFSTQNLNDFVKLLAGTVLGKLDSAPKKMVKRIGEFIKSCRPTFTTDPVTGSFVTSIDIAPDHEEATLKEIFEYLGSSEKRCYIAIDEFQQIAEYPERGVEALLRSYIQFLPNVNFIFAGSKQHIMQEMFQSPKRPFYQSTQTMSIDAIASEDYFEFAAQFFARQKRTLERETFDFIYNAFEGHTWYIQVVLNRLYSYSQEIDKSLVEYAITEIINESAYSYETLLAAYTSGSVRLIKAIAREGCVREINSGEFITRHNLKAASSVNSALKKLINNELIYKSKEGYIVYDRFMAIWLRRQLF